MFRIERSFRAGLGATLALLLVSACNRTENRSDAPVGGVGTGGTAEGAAVGTQTSGGDVVGGQAKTAEIELEDLSLGRTIDQENKVTDKTDSFGSGDVIYAVVETDENEAGLPLTARWTFGDDGQVVNEQTQTVAQGDEARTVFRLSKGSAWAKGDYRVQIMYNGREVKSAKFKIE